MKLVALLLVGCLASASSDYVEVFGQDRQSLLLRVEEAQEFNQAEELHLQEPQVEQAAMLDPLADNVFESAYVADPQPLGSYRVTGMFQNSGAEQQAINEVLDRPSVSFFDLSWSSWVDERLQLLDLVQDLLVTATNTRCPHMQPETASFDTGMVSYLASSRFGPAILTTYAQKIHEADSLDISFAQQDQQYIEFADDELYDDAAALNSLSLNDIEALQQAELDARKLSQKEDLVFFSTNAASTEEKAVLRPQLDGEFESVQPSVKVPVTYFARWESLDPTNQEDVQQMGSQSEDAAVNNQLTNCVIFVLLLVGCLYVWISLARSCCTTFSEARQRKRETKDAAYRMAQKELLAPLNPEKAAPIDSAAFEIPEGTYYAPDSTGFQKILVPLRK